MTKLIHLGPKYSKGICGHLLRLTLSSIIITYIIATSIIIIERIDSVWRLVLHLLYTLLKIGAHRHKVLIVGAEIGLLRHLHHLGLVRVNYITQLQTLGGHNVNGGRLKYLPRAARNSRVYTLLYRRRPWLRL